MTHRFQSEISLILSLTRYVVRRRWSIVPVTGLGIFSSLLELCAMAAIIPLGIMAGNGQLSTQSLWRSAPEAIGFSPDAKFYCSLFAFLMLSRALTMMLANILTQRTARDLIAHFSYRALDSFVRHLTFQDVQRQQIGHFLALAGDEANRAAQIVASLMRLVPFVVMFSLYFAILFYKSLLGGVAVVAAIGGMIWLLSGTFRRSRQLGQRQQEESRTLNSHFVDSLNGLRTVRGFTAEEFVASRYNEMIRGYVRTCFKVDVLSSVASSAPSIVLMATVLLGCLLFAQPDWLKTNLPLLLAGAMLILRLLPLANQALDITMKLTADLKAARNISEMLDVIQTQETGNKASAVLDEPIRRINFDRVTFRYAHDLPPVLTGLSLSFEAGTSYAITGPSGSGKSSLVDLVMKFFAPQSGRITVNDRDIATIADMSLRSRIVLAEQATRIFYDTMQHNLEFGRPVAQPALRDVLAAVGLEALVQSLPHGVDTLLDYQGSNLSGGQRQRIGLARAMLRAADVLILDESTNALDTDLRGRILDRLLADYRDKIIIFITHDRQVMDRVDKVIALSPASAILLPSENAPAA